MYLCKCLHMLGSKALPSPEEGVGSLGDGVIDSSEPRNMGAGIWTLVLKIEQQTFFFLIIWCSLGRGRVLVLVFGFKTGSLP